MTSILEIFIVAHLPLQAATLKRKGTKGKERKRKEEKGRMRVGHCLLSIFHLLGTSLALTIPDTTDLISSNYTRLSSVSHPYQLG